MAFKNGIFDFNDHEAIKKLKDFLPDRIFDAHCHLYDSSFLSPLGEDDCFGLRKRCEVKDYLDDMSPYFENTKEIRLNIITNPDAVQKDPNIRKASVDFLADQLEKYPHNVGEIIVLPDDTEEDIEKQLVHPAIRGFKCYHCFSKFHPTWDSAIEYYLPESAWKVAERKKMVITLHMVRDTALSDPVNCDYIISMSKKYPNATLILAHAARSFASWTAIEAIDKIARLDNVMFDFSAICESPALFQIIKKAGMEKCMWGSDYPVSRLAGKAISIGSSFYWINQNDLERFAGPTQFNSWLVGTENLMAVRQACIMLDLNENDIENLFYCNAAKLFGI